MIDSPKFSPTDILRYTVFQGFGEEMLVTLIYMLNILNLGKILANDACFVKFAKASPTRIFRYMVCWHSLHCPFSLFIVCYSLLIENVSLLYMPIHFIMSSLYRCSYNLLYLPSKFRH